MEVEDPAAGPVIAFRDVSVRFDGKVVLDGVSAAVAGGTVTVLTGPSGAGKTTLLRLCNRLEVPTGGSVEFRGRNTATMDPLALRRRVGMVFQRPNPFPQSVFDNVAFGPRALGTHRGRALADLVGRS